MDFTRHDLYIHVGGARHFVSWEMKSWRRHFRLVEQPHADALLLAIGPDVIDEGLALPASHRFLTTYPGYGHNPLHNPAARALDYARLPGYDKVFINPGPLQLAYSELGNVQTHPFSINIDAVPFSARTQLNSLLHASNDSPQKDWERSVAVMRATGLSYSVFPKRVRSPLGRQAVRVKSKLRGALRLHRALPSGYETQSRLRQEMLRYDGFVHVAADVRSPLHLDGKYTATLLEAGATGAILFWHDTFGLGNDFKMIFSLPVEPRDAAKRIGEVRSSINPARHGILTRENIGDVCRPERSVAARAEAMKAVASEAWRARRKEQR